MDEPKAWEMVCALFLGQPRTIVLFILPGVGEGFVDSFAVEPIPQGHRG